MKNQLWAMSDESLADALEAYEDAVRDAEQQRLYIEAEEALVAQTSFYAGCDPEKRTATINVTGVLTPNYTFLTWLRGGTAYSHLLLAVDEAENDESIDSVIFNFDTPGGAVTGCEEVEMAIRNMTKKKIGYVSGMACSGGYWLASAMDEIVGVETAEVGSIGVKATFTDTSKRDEKEGVRRVTIVSKNAPYKNASPFEKEGYDKWQKLINDTEDIFVEHIASNRGVAPETVRENYGQGGVFLMAEAIEHGMADGIKTFDTLRAEISQLRENDEMGIEMKDLTIEMLNGERPDLVEAISAKVDTDTIKAEAVKAERERLSALDELKGDCESANKIIDDAKESGKFASDIVTDVLKAEREERGATANAQLQALEEDADALPDVTALAPSDDADEALMAELKKFREEK